MVDYITVYVDEARKLSQTIIVSHIMSLQEYPKYTVLNLSNNSIITAWHSKQEILQMMEAKG